VFVSKVRPNPTGWRLAASFIVPWLIGGVLWSLIFSTSRHRYSPIAVVILSGATSALFIGLSELRAKRRRPGR
jgi:hypothetical protein